MATKAKKAKPAKKARRAPLADVQALAGRLQRELAKRRRIAATTLSALEKDLRALARLLSRRAGAVAGDVERHIRGLRRDLERQVRQSAVRGKRPVARKKVARKKK